MTLAGTIHLFPPLPFAGEGWGEGENQALRYHPPHPTETPTPAGHPNTPKHTPFTLSPSKGRTSFVTPFFLLTSFSFLFPSVSSVISVVNPPAGHPLTPNHIPFTLSLSKGEGVPYRHLSFRAPSCHSERSEESKILAILDVTLAGTTPKAEAIPVQNSTSSAVQYSLPIRPKPPPPVGHPTTPFFLLTTFYFLFLSASSALNSPFVVR